MGSALGSTTRYPPGNATGYPTGYAPGYTTEYASGHKFWDALGCAVGYATKYPMTY